MSDELLEDAFRALRERDEPVSAEREDATLARILESLEADPLLDEALDLARDPVGAGVASSEHLDDPSWATREAATLARIQLSLAQREVPEKELSRRSAARRYSWRSLSVAAALLMVVLVGAPSAWAWAVEWARALSADPEQEAPQTVPGAHPAGDEPRPLAPPAPADPEEEEPVPVVEGPLALPEGRDPPPVAAPARTPRRTRVPHVEAIASRQPEPSSEPSLEPVPPQLSPEELAERAAFEEAHRRHFQEGDPLRALDAWNQYLAAYPSGRFQQEARYNRAICLVRLGRAEEAQRALRPFADGRYGGYRQREARQLIDALDPLRGRGAEEAP